MPLSLFPRPMPMLFAAVLTFLAPAPLTGAEAVVFKLESLGAVRNGPSAPTLFTVDRPTLVTKIWTYHWNGGQGSGPITLGLRSLATGQMVGRWAAVGTYHAFNNTPGAVWPAQGDGPPFLYWHARPLATLAAGTYEVVDSDPGTWSTNGEMGGRGVAWVFADLGGGGGRDYSSGGRDYSSGPGFPPQTAMPAPQAPLFVRITPIHQRIMPGDKAVTNAVVRGGTPPYTYEWFNGPRLDKATGWTVTWTMGGPGRRDLRVVVHDAGGARGEARCEVMVENGP